MLQDVSEDFQRWWIRTHVQVAWGTVRKPVCIRPDFTLHKIFCHPHKHSTEACAMQKMHGRILFTELPGEQGTFFVMCAAHLGGVWKMAEQLCQCHDG